MTILLAGANVKYCTVRMTSNLDIVTATNTQLPMHAAISDPHTWWLTGDNKKITPDASIGLVQLGQQLRWEGNTTGRRENYVLVNGTGAFGGHARPQTIMSMPGSNDFEVNTWTPPLVNAVPGTDYYESRVWQNRGANVFIYSSATWFACIGVELT